MCLAEAHAVLSLHGYVDRKHLQHAVVDEALARNPSSLNALLGKTVDRVPTDHASDIFRSAAVLLHATLKEVVRGTAHIEWFRAPQKDVLDKMVPLGRERGTRKSV